MIDLEQRITFVLAKVRNICYYWSIDDRERKRYMHVIRSTRDQLKEILNLMDPNDSRRNLFLTLIRTIPAKTKTDECGDVINEISKIIEVY